MAELTNNERIIGGLSKNCSSKARTFFEKIIKGRIHITNARTAELCKLVENSYRDVNIAFANELSIICEKLNINVWELITIANKHPRVNILNPGPGVGGHCIAVDPWFIIEKLPEDTKLIKLARVINLSKTKYIINKIKKEINKNNKNLNTLTLSCFGISYKPNVPDLRESPGLKIAEEISSWGLKRLNIVEPNIDLLPSTLDKQNVRLTSINESIKSSDIILFLVGHESFKKIKFIDIKGTEVYDLVGISTNF